jgi:hypothetical protein
MKHTGPITFRAPKRASRRHQIFRLESGKCYRDEKAQRRQLGNHQDDLDLSVLAATADQQTPRR